MDDGAGDDSAGEEAAALTGIKGAVEQPRDTVSLGSWRSGDLWPSCWSNDDALYAAAGDGAGFSKTPHVYDVVVNRIEGRPSSHLSGSFLAGGNAVGQVWSGPSYYRKPSGMLCRDGRVYLAVQDMDIHLTHVQAASISVSYDHGASWAWNHDRPLFADRTFTTIFFLDYGKDSVHAGDEYVYVYGLDESWATRHELFLARVHHDHVRERAAWRFYAGKTSSGEPRFVADIAAKEPVLTDARVLHGQGPIAQGSVVYDAPLDRYLYSSWTERTHQLYAATRPWGPWRLVHQTDFGPYPWSRDHVGGYATTIPSKFVSADGRSMWLQSNCLPRPGHDCSENFFALRELKLQ